MVKALKPTLVAAWLLLGGMSGCKGTKPEAKPAPAKSESRAKQCSALVSTGTKEGQVAPNVTLTDADGNSVNLHDYCDKTVLLIAGTMF